MNTPAALAPLGSYLVLLRRGRTQLPPGIFFARSMADAEAYAARTAEDYGARTWVEWVAPWFGPLTSYDLAVRAQEG